jgi:RHS repeat-associated protein
VNGTTTTYATTDINPTGYSQVVGESYSPRVNGTESQHSYIYGLDAALELRSHYDGVGNNLTQQMYFVHDGHGSVRAITDQNGAITDTYDYDAFGVLIHQTGTTPNTTLFAGEQFDPDLNLYYNRVRYLNSNTGRFWSMDTFEGDDESPLSLHKYLYASADPVDRQDPSGHESLAEISVGVAITSVLSGAAAKAYTGTWRGAGFGALGGGLIALAFLAGTPKQKVDVVISGAANATAQALANTLTEYYDGVMNIPPPTQQAERELIVEAFAAGTVTAFLGNTFNVPGAGVGFANTFTTAYFQKKPLASVLPSAILGALLGSAGGRLNLPEGNTLDLYGVAKVVSASVLKTISTASTPVFKATIRELDPNLYTLLYGE